MTLGYAFTKQRIDAQAGDAAYQLREALARITRYKADLDSLSDPELTAMGYTAGEVTVLRASFTDLDKLAAISRGAATQPAASDFFFNAKQLIRLS